MTSIIDIPRHMRGLPKDPKYHLPIPWFVAQRDGKPDFRLVRGGAALEAIHRDICWICGEKLGRYRAFLVGPVTTITKTHSEPPSHRECAEFAARNCPFLATPSMARSTDLPEQSEAPAGLLSRNPGVVALWIVEAKGKRLPYFEFKTPTDEYLIRLTEPSEIVWYRERRQATREEVYNAIVPVIPSLLATAKTGGDREVERLKTAVLSANKLLPQE